MAQKTYFGKCSYRDWAVEKLRSHWNRLCNSQLLIGKAVVTNSSWNISTLSHSKTLFPSYDTFEQLQLGWCDFHFGTHKEGAIPISDTLFSWQKGNSRDQVKLARQINFFIDIAYLTSVHLPLAGECLVSTRWKCIVSGNEGVNNSNNNIICHTKWGHWGPLSRYFFSGGVGELEIV